ncbi:hypothetical protein [Embleya sp. MST-111070]|uniref:hypothetical protein n=1 Tax=Embleya sp. MST-111070 TaxID=3398231 RepID=UPI003F737551
MRAALRAARVRVSGARGIDPTMPDSVRRASVKVPLRVVTGEAYSDLAFVFAAKVGHLAAGPNQPGCIADLTTIARYLGLTVRSVTQPDGRVALKAPSSLYAAQKQLTAGEELTVVRRTKPSGTGTSAVRRLRAPEKGEPWVMVPVALLGAVPHRHARAYAVISYARARGHHLTYAELADVLRHQSGRRIGEPVSVRAARGVVSDLERWGWVEVGRREGWQGRNMMVPLRPFEPGSDDESIAEDAEDAETAETAEAGVATEANEGMHRTDSAGAAGETSADSRSDRPVALGAAFHVGAGTAAFPTLASTVNKVVETPGGTPSEAASRTVVRTSSEPPENGISAAQNPGAEGQWTSGPQGVRTSVTYKEDTPIDLQMNAASRGGSARRALSLVDVPGPANSARPGSATLPANEAPAAEPRRSRHVTVSNDRTTISPTAAKAFARIGPLVDRMSTGQRVVAAALVDRAVAEVGDADRVFARLADRWRTQEGPVRSPMGWLGARGLARRGCADPNCEDGRLWLPTAGPGAGVAGDPFACRNCARQDQDRRAAADERFGADRRAASRARTGREPSTAMAAAVGTAAHRVAVPAPIGTCDDCDRAVRGLRADGVCADCREEREAAAEAAERASGALQGAFERPWSRRRVDRWPAGQEAAGRPLSDLAAGGPTWNPDEQNESDGVFGGGAAAGCRRQRVGTAPATRTPVRVRVRP